MKAWRHLRVPLSMLLVVGTLAFGGGQPASVLAAADLQEAVRFRTEFGFVSDTAAIQAIAADSDADVRYGTPLTSDEAAEMDRRVAVERQLSPLGTYLGTVPEFGGWYIDQASGHILDIAFTADPKPYLSKIQERIPDGMAYRTRTVRFTEQELREVQERIDQDGEWLEDLGVTVYEDPLNVRLNIVELGVSNAAPEITKAISERYGSDVIRIYPTDPGQLTDCLSRNHCHTPLRGGTQMYDSGCSNAFFVTKNGVYYTLSAGHCYIAGHTYQHPDGTNLGQMVAETFYNNTSADAGIIRIPSSERSRRVYITASSYYPMLYVQQRGSPGEVVGMSVCMSGRQRGEGASCGTIWAIDFSINLSGTVLVHQRSATYTVIDGDSGGAVFSGNTAFGVQSGENDQQRAIYSHITYALSGLGVSLCTTCP